MVRASRADVLDFPVAVPRPAPALRPVRVVWLHSRPHIDLQRVAACLCRS
ncbi:putative leader peptide [Streptomyces sp. BI20]